MLCLSLDHELVLRDAHGTLLIRLALPAQVQGRFPPTPAQLEQAIAEIEDALMPQLPALAGRPGPLHSHSTAANALREPAGLAPTGTQWLSRQSLEALFNRLADVANGAPARHLGLAEERPLAVGLTALRELLHHADLPGLWLEP